MQRVFGGTVVLLVLLQAGHLFAAKGVGVLKRVDAAKGIIVLTIGEQDYNLKAEKDITVRDVKGGVLTASLKSRELKSGVGVTFTYERRGREVIVSVLQLLAAPPKSTKDPTRTSVGFKPLCDMTAGDRYKGEDGGLYGRGKNNPPSEHQAATKRETAKVVPRDRAGKPSKDGKIVFISIGYSNVTSMFSMFKRIADVDRRKSAAVTIVDCAQGGQTMARWARPDHKSWVVAAQLLKRAGVTPEQVQVVWMKLANGSPTGKLQEHARQLQQDTIKVLQNLKMTFPNLRIVYLGSRAYGGYSTGRLNPEPYAYEGAFAVRWLILDQIKKHPSLNYDPKRGPVKAPLLLWGPYLWADGTKPRNSDRLIWESRDFAGDGVHPTTSGRIKVAKMLLEFLNADGNARSWFVRPKGER